MESASAQRSQVEELTRAAGDFLTTSDRVNALAKDWWDRWSSYTEGGQAPGPISNLSLYERYTQADGMRGAALRRDLSRNVDYVYVPTLVWNKLYSWYGGGPETELFVFQGDVDWAPVPLGVQTNLDTHFFLISLRISLAQLKKFFCGKMQLPEGRYELTRGGKVMESSNTLSTSGISAYMVFLLRERRIHLDLPAVYEDQGSDPMEVPVYDMEYVPRPINYRTDGPEMRERIQTSASLPKLSLQIKNIRSTRKHVLEMDEDIV